MFCTFTDLLGSNYNSLLWIYTTMLLIRKIMTSVILWLFIASLLLSFLFFIAIVFVSSFVCMCFYVVERLCLQNNYCQFLFFKEYSEYWLMGKFSICVFSFLPNAFLSFNNSKSTNTKGNEYSTSVYVALTWIQYIVYQNYKKWCVNAISDRQQYKKILNSNDASTPVLAWYFINVCNRYI